MRQLQIQKSPSATELSQFSQNMSPMTDPPKGSATGQLWLHGWGIKDTVPHQLFLFSDVSSTGKQTKQTKKPNTFFIVCVEVG